MLFIARFRFLFQRYASALLLSMTLRQFIKATKKRFLVCIKTAPASIAETGAVHSVYWCSFRHSMPTNWHSVFEVLVISVFRGLSVHFSERFFQIDHCFFDDFSFIGRAICKLFRHPAVEHRLCFFDLDAEQLVR